MLTAYIQSVMRHATYEILDDQTFYGEIAGFQGVYVNADALEQCREELQSVLEGWIILGLRMDHPLPGCFEQDFAAGRGQSVNLREFVLDSSHVLKVGTKKV